MITDIRALPLRAKVILGGVAVVLIGVSFWALIALVSESYSHAKTQKALNEANENIKSITVERDSARSDAAIAKGQAIELTNQLASVDVTAGQSEVRLTAARKTTKEAKKHYETTTQVTTVNDNRSSDVKREELRARYARRGIIVTEK